MKLVTAIINSDKLDRVRNALMQAEITRITVSRCSGRGQAESKLYRGLEVAPNLVPKIRLDIACNDEFVQVTVDAILQGARTGPEGAIGDGKIFITALEECIRIRTGETGSTAI